MADSPSAAVVVPSSSSSPPAPSSAASAAVLSSTEDVVEDLPDKIDISFDFSPTPYSADSAAAAGGAASSVLGNPADHRLDLFIASSR